MPRLWMLRVEEGEREGKGEGWRLEEGAVEPHLGLWAEKEVEEEAKAALVSVLRSGGAGVAGDEATRVRKRKRRSRQAEEGRRMVWQWRRRTKHSA